MVWWPDHSQESGADARCVRLVYRVDYRVHLEADRSVRSMKLPLAAYGTENSAAVGAWVLLELNDAEGTGGTVEEGGQNSQLGGSEAGRERLSVSRRGRASRPNVRDVDRVD